MLKPRTAYLCGTIGELIGCRADDPRVVRCALSVQSQFNGLLWSQAVAKIMHGGDTTPGSLDEVAEHITQFSLGGIARIRDEA